MLTILVPTDFSNEANNAAKYALHLARQMNASLVLFNVYENFIATGPVETAIIPFVDFGEISTRLLKRTKSRLTKLEPGVPISYAKDTGFVTEAIHRFADSIKPDLIIMGMQGKGNIGGFFGSTSIATIKDSKFPLLLIPSRKKFKLINNITYAYDLGKISKGVAIWIHKFASIFNAEVSVIGLITDPMTEVKSVLKAEVNLKRAMKDIPFKAYFKGATDVVSGVLEFIDNSHAGLLIAAHREHDFFHRMLHASISKELSSTVKIPILVVPEKVGK